MDRAGFVATFGARLRAFALDRRGGLGQRACLPTPTPPAGVHRALCAALAPARRSGKLALLRAHPDLAGKLAQAGRLTAELTTEQASAGLDRLTDEERQTFTALNDAYHGEASASRSSSPSRA